MKSILQINSSIQSADGYSSRLAGELAASLRARHPGARLVVRDLARRPVPHLDAERFGAFATPAEKRTVAQQALVAESDALIEELKAADAIVLGMPMYNFGVPSQLKAWIDHVLRAGVTFRYTANGPVGLLAGKKAYIVATRGGSYAGTSADNQTPHIRQALALIGISDLEVVYAEGLAISEASREQSLAAARSNIGRLFGPQALAA
ncbi:MAG TPA: NAD(P)H-dependent oxidoreductase [Burkholderiales bacterium]|nr:NAD(P)H-dependent oxidoreductase [Burkholderiales bacterium]